jgi:hypothetical protein
MLAMKVTDIRRMVVQATLDNIKFMTPHLNRKKVSMVVCTCYLSYGGKHKLEDVSPGWPDVKKQDLISKITRA